MKPKTLAATVAALVLVGCSSPGTQVATTSAGRSVGSPKASERDRTTRPHASRSERDRRQSGRRTVRPGTTPEPGSSSSPKGSSGNGRNVVAAYPAPGTYVYSQSGTEEFCAGGKCDNERLPPTEREQTRITDRGNGHTTIVSEIRSSDGRYVRTTIDYADDVALITEVYYSFSYDGFSFSDDYTPSPPVRSILFPLTVGRSWSGSWDAKTSGTYAMKITGVDDATVNGHSIHAYRLDTSEHFSGEYQGKAAITVWIDAATKAVVKTAGALRLTNSIGSYDTQFTTNLEQGPSYP